MNLESMATPRFGLSAAVVGSIVLAVGGWNGVAPVPTVESFDATTACSAFDVGCVVGWTTMAGTLANGRFHSAMTVL